MCNLWIIKITKMLFLAIKIDLRRKFVSRFVVGDTEEASGVVFWRLPDVVNVLLLGDFAQVAKPVVKAIAVDVVNCFWHTPMRQKPSKLMPPDFFSAYVNHQIFLIFATNFFPGPFCARCLCSCERPGLWIIGDVLAHQFPGEFLSNKRDWAFHFTHSTAGACSAGAI